MKYYFLAFDFYNKNINKFWYGVIKSDINKQNLPEIVEQIIIDNFNDICPEDITMKVTAFNNIE